MRRLVMLAALCSLVVPASAQMRGGGGRAGMGARTGFASHGAFRGNIAGRSGMGFRPGSGFPATNGSGGFGSGFHHNNQFRHHRFHHRFRDRFGFAYVGYPWWGYYDPFFSDYSYDESSYRENTSGAYDTAVYDQQARLEDKLDRIEDRLDALVNRLQSPPAPTRAAAQAAPSTNSDSTVTFIFRDGHKEQVENYAIVGQTLWIFTEQRARKVPLNQLDPDATEKSNEQHGVDVHLPRA